MRSRWKIEERLASDGLMPLLADQAWPDANIHVVYLERNQLSVKLRTFVEFPGEYLQWLTSTVLLRQNRMS